MLSAGIVGLPNVGKSTLFNSLTKAGALVANYPFATINPNVGIVEVADERLNTLAKLYDTEKIVPATISITDIAGLVAGASKGEGLGNQFLGNIRSCQAILQVVRAFKDSSVTHVDDLHNPTQDIDTINTELVLADLETVDRRIAKLQKEVKANPKLNGQINAYMETRKILDSGNPLWTSTTLNLDQLEDAQLLTIKPIIYVFNVDEEGLSNEAYKKELADIVAPTRSLFICAKLEYELIELDESDQHELLISYGQEQSGLVQLSRSLYELLDLQSFLTAGKKEVRAWTIKKGSTAPQAAGAIHTDFERGFIAADVISYQDLIDAGSLSAARSTGKVRTEGKDYIVKNDDVIEFKFNVSKKT